ncbi:non-ribosomal peptide synthase protein (TIGR01720 family)/amino acid adenylation domain-containing protein [Brevibacillus sp. AG162]|uniref:non-ribosomal peptide synthetase n=1 Tax=Brevibacillus sp. AG162 TaxID=2572910 RepID=UPI001152DC12|nr:non-ribosomal peptide synthetase [Brevibacillus sp. AG162]TQK75360.1 non-ribosomal peptide synthase protein (TIGR01720 family)/amino acid adenylation domain-containing protein [Brevibacillus sp. AG162]
MQSLVLPLTHPQKRIWYIEKIYPNLPMYNIGGIVHLKGPVELALLEEAIHLFLEKHEGVHVRISEHEGIPAQIVVPYRRETVPLLDFSQEDDPQAAAAKWAETEFRRAFQLVGQPLYCFALLKMTEQHNAYFVKFHHLVADGWSIQIMTDQICSQYLQLLAQEEIDQTPEPSYIETIKGEREYLESARCTKNRRYWLDKFRLLPEGFLHKSSDDLSGRRKRYLLDGPLSMRIREYVEQTKCSLNTYFTGLVLLDLYKTTQQQDLIIGSPVLNRSGAKEKRMVGMFTSTVPFRTTVNGEAAASEFLKRLNREFRDAYFHQRYPYDLLVSELELNKQGVDQLFQVCVNYYNTKLVSGWDGVTVENEEFYSGYQVYSLQVVIKDWQDSGRIELQFDFKRDDYDEDAIERMQRRMVLLSEQILLSGGQVTIDGLTILEEAEREELLVRRNRTVTDYPSVPVHQLFVQQAKAAPHRIAAILGRKTLTYGELHEGSNRLAHLLKERGIGPGSIVAVHLRHSFELLISLFAVLKSGAAYLPMDPAYPSDRISFLLKDSRAALLLADESFSAGAEVVTDIIRVNELANDAGSPEDLETSMNAEAPAYVIYTSGSTGLPKGVVVTERGLVNYVWWAMKSYLRGPDDVSALYTSLAFDLTVTSIYPVLICGGAIAIYPAKEDEFVLDLLLREGVATVVKTTPAHLALIREKRYPDAAVHTLIVGGEDLKASLAADVLSIFDGRVSIFNEYGPTETVVGCMFHRYDQADGRKGSVPIGRPIFNTRLYLLDPRGEPVPIGQKGELCIAGDGVALGYLNRPELTVERFVQDPWGTGRMFKTGDVARWRADEVMEYLGRMDSQVKVKGHRIELGEVENQLLAVEGVVEAVVVDVQDASGQTALAGFVVTNGGLTAFEIRKTLLGRLPSYLVPAYLVLMDSLPLTSNGKVDRKALPDPLTESSTMLTNSLQSLEILRNILQSILQVDQVAASDNFYHLGGDSIKAIQVVSKLSEVGLHLKVRDILSYPVIGELAAVIEEQSLRVAAAQVPVEGQVRLTPIVAWFWAQELTNPNFFHQTVFLKLRHLVSPSLLQTAVTCVMRHHDTLRLRYDEAVGTLWYDPAWLTKEFDLAEITVSDEDDLQRQAQLFKESLRLTRGPLFGAALFHMQEVDYLLLTAHHLLVDAVSWHVLLEDLNLALTALSREEEVKFPAKTMSYQAWADALHDMELDEELPYWQQVLEEETETLPYEFDYGADLLRECKAVTVNLSKEETGFLITDANRAYNTQPIDLLLTALGLALREMSGTTGAVTVESEGHGREPFIEEQDISRTVGWFTALYPIRLTFAGELELGEAIKQIKEQVFAVPNKGIGYGVLSALRGKLREVGRKRVRFNYLGVIDNQAPSEWIERSSLDTGPEQSGENVLTARLDIVAYVQDQRLSAVFTYSTRKFSPDTMERFASLWRLQVQRLIAHCMGKEDREFTPSDFETAGLSQEALDLLFE